MAVTTFVALIAVKLISEIAAVALDTSPGPIEVCHGTNFDTKKFSCCDDFEICSRNMRQCCGKHCFSVGSSLCCDGHIIDKCSQFNSACCGQICIDLGKKACKDGKVIEACAGAESAWCNDTCFDKSTHLCCGGKITARCGYDRTTADCCGAFCYNSKVDSCCNNVIVHPKCDSCCGTKCCADAR